MARPSELPADAELGRFQLFLIIDRAWFAFDPGLFNILNGWGASWPTSCRFSAGGWIIARAKGDVRGVAADVSEVAASCPATDIGSVAQYRCCRHDRENEGSLDNEGLH